MISEIFLNEINFLYFSKMQNKTKKKENLTEILYIRELLLYSQKIVISYWELS